MPIIHVSETGKQDTQKKRDFMEFAANSICSHTNTLPKNIYVYFHEMEPENVRKTAPTARIDWTMIPDRTNEVKKAIMGELTDELAKLIGENRNEIAIIFNDMPLSKCHAGRNHPGRQLQLVNKRRQSPSA